MKYEVKEGQVYSDKHKARNNSVTATRKFKVLNVDSVARRALVVSFTETPTATGSETKFGKQAHIKLSRFQYKYYKLETPVQTDAACVSPAMQEVPTQHN